MRIKDGNIFAGMRLVLPEHRKLMKEYESAQDKPVRPVLSEDELSAMNYKLSQAIEEQKKIRVTCFENGQLREYEGVPVLSHGKIALYQDGKQINVLLHVAIQVDLCT